MNNEQNSREMPDITIRMSLAERRLFEQSLAHRPVYLEFGCGGSTEIAAATGCPMIVSVESDSAWITTLSQKELIAKRLTDNSLRFIHVDIGPVGSWGFPLNETKIRNWPKYCTAPFGNGLEYKYILVDGRFRTACAYVAWAFMLSDAILAIHDYTVRKEYYDIEKIFEIVDRADTLVLLRKKTHVIEASYVTSLISSLLYSS